MDPFILSVAFVLGFIAKQFGLPPMVGFLITGFVLHGAGIEGGEIINTVADLGVTLLLFTIGLKLRLKSLASPVVWAGASIHMTLTSLFFAGGLFILGLIGVAPFTSLTFPLALLVGFSLSFSSTVFAVKILEEKAEAAALHGRLAIGILIMQDLFAVIFLTLSLGKIPALWTLLIPLILLIFRPILYRVLDRSGHGELLLLFGLFVALALGAGMFELGGLKPDLGALILGILLAGHKKSAEVAKVLMGVKELFLVGFFLTIGLAGIPDATSFFIALLLVLVLPIKGLLFIILLTRFNLRGRTSLLAGLVLSNYSEFGLIVIAVGAGNGWIGPEWLAIIAVALAISFIVTAPLNTKGDIFYERYRGLLQKFETRDRHPDDQPVDTGLATIGIFGMGRLGTGAYEVMVERYGDRVIGFDFNQGTVDRHRQAGRNVVLGDPTDPDFWIRLTPNADTVPRLAMLAMPKHSANLAAVNHLRHAGFAGQVTAIATFDDQVKELLQAGADKAYNMYNEAGVGFAETVYETLESGLD